jgi:hypothetical protein
MIHTARIPMLLVLLLTTAVAARADDPPDVKHQAVPCTIPNKAISLCANVTDDNQVAKVRAYFRRTGEKFFSFVEMSFSGLNFCGTLPAPKDNIGSIEYYIQAMDDQFQAARTSTYQIQIQPEAVCGFPADEKDPQRAAAITVYATHKDQGKKVPEGFVATGVTFVPVTGK